MADELTVIQQEYNLASIAKPVAMAENLREMLMEDKTDKNYVDIKQGFPYVKHQYMDDKFKKYYPIYNVSIVGNGPTIINNYWVVYTVEIKAYLTPSIFISEIGAGGARLQIPSNLKKAIDSKAMSVNDITPLDYIDVGNDFKSALTKAITNCQSRFGVGADVYNKGIFPQEIRNTIELAVVDIIDKNVVLPMEKTRIKAAWDACKQKNGNIFNFLESLREKYNVFDENLKT